MQTYLYLTFVHWDLFFYALALVLHLVKKKPPKKTHNYFFWRFYKHKLTYTLLHTIPTNCDISSFTLSCCVAGCHHQVGGGNVDQRTGEWCSAAELLFGSNTVVIHCICGGKHRCVPRNCGRGAVSTVHHFYWWTRSWERRKKPFNGISSFAFFFFFLFLLLLSCPCPVRERIITESLPIII